MQKFERKAVCYTSQERSLYVGKMERIIKRVNVSSTLLVSTEDELSLLDSQGKTVHRSKSLLVPAGMDVTIDTHNAKIAMCFLNDLGTDLQNLKSHMNDQFCFTKNKCVLSTLEHEAEIIKHARFLGKANTNAEEALGLLDSWINDLSHRQTLQTVSDARITKAVEHIKAHSSENISVDEIAQVVNLSVPRLVQLFKQVTGSPIRRFRQWHRIFATANKLTEGYSLTNAAVDAGFADYAQFSRVYRQFAGASPSAARNNTDIRVLSAA